jgi:hypothetical protein
MSVGCVLLARADGRKTARGCLYVCHLNYPDIFIEEFTLFEYKPNLLAVNFDLG